MSRQVGSPPNVLSIAGSDPSGGAGIQADLKTFAALGCHGMAVITALTAQNTRTVTGVHLPPAAFVAEQIDTLAADVDVAAVKIGMLGSGEIARAVAASLDRIGTVPVVLDPVLVATSGAALGDGAVLDALRVDLFPRATLVTPNLAEAALLAGLGPLGSRESIEAAARTLQAGTSTAWLIKGGHRGTATADDFLLTADEAHWFSAPRHPTQNTHGTGCTLSSAIAAFLARGVSLVEAVRLAKDYLGAALAGADRLRVGGGPGPLAHFVRWR